MPDNTANRENADWLTAKRAPSALLCTFEPVVNGEMAAADPRQLVSLSVRLDEAARELRRIAEALKTSRTAR